jgi:hypothetical protein
MKTLLDLCVDYGIPVHQDGNHWSGPCIWSFDESQSLTIDPAQDRWEDWITGHSGDIIDFVTVVEARLAHLGRNRFDFEDWFANPVESPIF